jgi:hypothetical protein
MSLAYAEKKPNPLDRVQLRELAQQYAQDIDTDEDRDNFWFLAVGALMLEASLDDAEQKHTALYARLNTATHELEHLRQQPAPWIPAVHIKCDGKGCHAVVAFDPAPEEAVMAEVLRAARWAMDETRHWCSRCK